jgi:hypothetical protein
LQARFRAAVDPTDQGATFCEGHELDKASAALILSLPNTPSIGLAVAGESEHAG